MTPVTTINKITGEVNFAHKKRGGDVAATIQFLSPNGLGELQPSGRPTRVSLSDVVVLDGFRFDLMSSYITYQQESMAWEQIKLETASYIEKKLLAEVSQKVNKEVDTWIASSPRPKYPANITSECQTETAEEPEGTPVSTP